MEQKSWEQTPASDADLPLCYRIDSKRLRKEWRAEREKKKPASDNFSSIRVYNQGYLP